MTTKDTDQGNKAHTEKNRRSSVTVMLHELHRSRNVLCINLF